MEDVKKWLDSKTPDYNAGVLLFSKHSRNASLLHYFQRKGGVAMSKLRYELEKIAGIDHFKVAAKVKKQRATTTGTTTVQPAKEERVKINTDGSIKREDLPEELRALFDQNTEDYKVMRGAHAAMAASKNKDERKALRGQIDALDDAIAARWATIDHWVATGELPKDAGSDDAAAANGNLSPQQINAYRTYISRYTTTDVAKLNDVKRKELQKRIYLMLAAGQNFDEATITKLHELGFNTEKSGISL